MSLIQLKVFHPPGAGDEYVSLAAGYVIPHNIRMVWDKSRIIYNQSENVIMSKIKTMAISGPKITINWSDGVTQEMDVSTLDRAMVWNLAADRAKSKLEDAHADRQGRGVEWCREQTDSVWDALVRGDWNRGRSGNPWLIEALTDCFAGQIDEEKAREIYADEDARKKAYKLPEVRKWKAERDAAAVEDAPKTDIASLF